MLLCADKGRPVGQRQSLGPCILSLVCPGVMRTNCVICTFANTHHHYQCLCCLADGISSFILFYMKICKCVMMLQCPSSAMQTLFSLYHMSFHNVDSSIMNTYAFWKIMLLHTHKGRPVGQCKSLGPCILSLVWPGVMRTNCVICTFACMHQHSELATSTCHSIYVLILQRSTIRYSHNFMSLCLGWSVYFQFKPPEWNLE